MKKIILTLLLSLTLISGNSYNISTYNTIKETVFLNENIKFKELSFAKFVYESGYFRSTKSIKYNNFTGMKFNKREFVKGRTKDGYAIYSSHENCLKDYEQWQLKHLVNINTEQQYLNYLKKVYCKKNPHYIRNIIKIRNKIFGN